MKQTKKYNSGVFALIYLLNLRGYDNIDPEQLEIELGTTEEYGTSHNEIIYWLDKHDIEYEIDNYLTKFPLLVNYKYNGVEHYSVIEYYYENMLWIYNVATGDYDKISYFDFDDVWYAFDWDSEKYSPKWGLYIKRKEVEAPPVEFDNTTY